MAALIIVAAATVTLGVLFGVVCEGIRRVDKYGTLRKAPTPLRRLTGAHAARWEGSRYA